ncbi:Transcription elongation factor S-II [Porphyridium purpureum]|uniref:Transcription elongation factor S-II n=1 Tax=Porphyridium purpureum TaxID=35688 RepID=A0A5J4YQ29_PORPP|nr:Transcription elongation factor S-II [Porphyridium purpureum]|eukprot:POR9395..scf222_8
MDSEAFSVLAVMDASQDAKEVPVGDAVPNAAEESKPLAAVETGKSDEGVDAQGQVADKDLAQAKPAGGHESVDVEMKDVDDPGAAAGSLEAEAHASVDNAGTGSPEMEVDSAKPSMSGDTPSTAIKMNRKVSNKSPKVPKRALADEFGDEDPKLGSVVWGKVRGYPWWPAAVLPNNKSKEWKHPKTEKVWVMFFGEDQGSWLKNSPNELSVFNAEESAIERMVPARAHKEYERCCGAADDAKQWLTELKSHETDGVVEFAKKFFPSYEYFGLDPSEWQQPEDDDEDREEAEEADPAVSKDTAALGKSASAKKAKKKSSPTVSPPSQAKKSAKRLVDELEADEEEIEPSDLENEFMPKPSKRARVAAAVTAGASSSTAREMLALNEELRKTKEELRKAKERTKMLEKQLNSQKSAEGSIVDPSDGRVFETPEEAADDTEMFSAEQIRALVTTLHSATESFVEKREKAKRAKVELESMQKQRRLFDKFSRAAYDEETVIADTLQELYKKSVSTAVLRESKVVKRMKDLQGHLKDAEAPSYALLKGLLGSWKKVIAAETKGADATDLKRSPVGSDSEGQQHAETPRPKREAEVTKESDSKVDAATPNASVASAAEEAKSATKNEKEAGEARVTSKPDKVKAVVELGKKSSTPAKEKKSEPVSQGSPLTADAGGKREVSRHSDFETTLADAGINLGDDKAKKVFMKILLGFEDSEASHSYERPDPAVAHKIVQELLNLIRTKIQDKEDQKEKQISLRANLARNVPLRTALASGEITCERLISMSSDELKTAEQKKEAEIAQEKLIKDAQGGATVTASTDEFPCPKCKKREVSYYQMQTRSADEPMTSFFTCQPCGHKWKD